MDSPPRIRSEEEGRSYPDDSIRASYGVIVKICLWSGLSPADADDLAQDLWEWLIRTGVPMELIATPWLKTAVRNYILRFRRRSFCRSVREGCSLESVAEPQAQPSLSTLEAKELLDRISAGLPRTERRMLALIRRGYTIADAARILKIPTGSRDFHKGQIVAYARREFQCRRKIPITQG